MARSITVRFIIVISLLALLSTIAFFTLQGLIDAQEDNAHLVGVNGGQLLHSQRIAVTAAGLVNARDAESSAVAEDILRRSTDVMRNTHNLLTSSDGPVGHLFKKSSTLQRLYYQPPYQLDAQVRHFLQTADNLLSANTEHERQTYLQTVLTLSRGNLPEGLHRAVKEYQYEVAARIRSLQTWRIIILAGIYLLLAVDVLLVFRPLLARVRMNTNEMDDLRHKLEDTAARDQVTGLLCRKMLKDVMEREAQVCCNKQKPMALLLIELDQFGEINRAKGHDAGDRLLREVGQLLLNNLRDTDYVFRYGGGKFAVLATGTPADGNDALAQKLFTLIRANKFHSGLRILARFGGSGYIPGEELEEMIGRAEQALDLSSPVHD